MPLQPLSNTQRALLTVLVSEGFRFLIVGGYAVRLHGVMRATADLDILMEPTDANVETLAGLIGEIGRPITREWRQRLTEPRAKLRWCDVEIFTSMGDIDFTEAYDACLLVPMDAVQIPVVSRDHLIHSKRLALMANDRGEKRHIDQADLDALTGAESMAF